MSKQPYSSSSPSVAGITIDVQILQGRELVAKDKAFGVFGKKTSSDPYAVLYWDGKKMGRTKTKQKTLRPDWSEKFKIEIGQRRADRLLAEYDSTQSQQPHPKLTLVLFDEDDFSRDDCMGVVTIPLPRPRGSGEEEDDVVAWYPVTTGRHGKYHCKNAKGNVQVRVGVSVRRALDLNRGDSRVVGTRRLRVGLGWEMESENAAVDLDLSCVAIDKKGRYLEKETVYFGNLSNPNGSVTHSGDEREGDEDIRGSGDDEIVKVDLQRVPARVLAFYFLLTVSTPGRTFQQVGSARIRVTDDVTDAGLFQCVPRLEEGDGTALFLVRLSRTSSGGWVSAVILDFDRTARDFGSLIPAVKGYSRDIVPGIKINPKERVAILRKQGAVLIRGYCRTPELPAVLNVGLAWDITNGKNIDLDASAILLDWSLTPVDFVYFKQLSSNDGTVVHCGDEREGDEEGFDERISLHLNRVNPSVAHIGIVINSYSGEELDDVTAARTCLYDPHTNDMIATYDLTNNKEVDGHTGLIVGSVYRESPTGDWCLRIISVPVRRARFVKDCVTRLQSYLLEFDDVTPYEPPAPEDVVLREMPPPVLVPNNDDGYEAAVLPPPVPVPTSPDPFSLGAPVPPPGKPPSDVARPSHGTNRPTGGPELYPARPYR